MPRSLGLTAREKAFIESFIELRHQTKAYIAAGYAAKGAPTNAARLIAKDHIQKALKLAEAEIRARLAPTVDRIIENLARMGFVGMSKFMRVDEFGNPSIDLSACTQSELDLVQEMTTETYVEGGGEAAREVKKVRIKLYDRMKALEKMGQHLGMFKGAEEETVDALGALLKDIIARGSAIPVKPQGPLGSGPKPWKTQH